MILFLDFDGVLHPQPNDGAQFSNAPRVWELLARHPEVSIVFSTGWRFEHTLAALRQFATQQGGEHLADRFIDAGTLVMVTVPVVVAVLVTLPCLPVAVRLTAKSDG